MSQNDYLLALQLQEYDSLDDVPKVIESWKDKENRPNNKTGNHKSLVDPTWETIDPTPDIHTLFIQFNQAFFWNKLDAVEVRWSPRMTLCAGVCVYKGRGGCSVRLSLPLLKLRPRKDLVETLLHEMIHAYLFVTHNNKDRDGHGPEFHRHMYRINRDAGTNISVFHSFHDEVKSYQQHWWRCDGPCQKRPPFFGMVRRSMNRAPGPYDSWYADHKATCAGNFIKVREPEGYKDQKKGKDKAVPSSSKASITNYFGKVTKGSSSGGLPKNVTGFGNLNKPFASTPTPLQGSSMKNVVGFKDLNGGAQPTKTPTNSWKGQGKKLGGGMLANRGGGTLVVTGKGKKTDDPRPTTDLSSFTPFAGSGNVLGTKSTSSTSTKTPLTSSRSFGTSSSRSPTFQPDLSRWLPPVKRPSDAQPGTSKLLKSEKSKREAEIIVLSDDELPEYGEAAVPCPSCGRKVDEFYINTHLDVCLAHSSHSGNASNLDKTEPHTKTEPCPVCNKQMSSAGLQSHTDLCLCDSWDEDDMTEAFDGKLNTDKKEGSDNVIDVTDEEGKGSDDWKKNCFICDKDIVEGDLVDHLEVCKGLQISTNHVISDDETDEEEEAAVGESPRKCQSGEKLYPCPVCTHLFAESCMNKHLDVCMSP